MAVSSERELQGRLAEKTGTDCSWLSLGTIPDQEIAVREDVHKVRAHPLVPDRIQIGGFMFDVDTGELRRLV
jgi:carbonic anhydrase